jgi:uncharacterized membrane protein YfcA
VYAGIMGILGGCFGFGPSFGLPGIYLLGIEPTIKKSIGTISLSSPATYAAAYKHYLHHNVDIKIGIIYAVVFFVCAPIGAIANKHLSYASIFLALSIINFISGAIYLFLYFKS